MRVQTIKVYYDEDGLFGSEGPTGYDVEASYEKFEQLVTEAIKSDYPEIEVDVVYKQTLDPHEVYPPHADNYEEVKDSVDYEVQKIYSDFEWAVPSPEFI